MVSEQVTVTNPSGLHMRPAQLLVNAVRGYPCRVTLRYQGREVMGKSFMNLVAAGIPCGAKVEVVCDGAGEADALAEAAALFADGFGE